MHLSLVASLALLASGGAPPLVPTAATLPTVVKPMFFSEIVGQSELIAVGTAVAATSRHEEGGNTIRTYVTFRDLAVQKGRVDGATLVLRLEGGAVGDDRLVIADMPQFKVGSRYLLYVVGNGTNLSPITGFNQGAFEVVQVNGREVLRNLRGEELIGVREDRFVFAQKPAAGAPAVPAAAAPAAVAVPIDVAVQPPDPDLDRREREMVARQQAAAAQVAPLQRAPEPARTTPPAVAPSAPPAQASVPTAAPVPSAAVQTQRDARPILVPAAQDRGERMSLQTLLGGR